MLRKILNIALLLFISMNVYAYNNRVLCKPSQLKLYLLAIASPGMNHTNSLYGIINHGKRSCVIPGNLAIWGAQSNGKEAKLNMWHWVFVESKDNPAQTGSYYHYVNTPMPHGVKSIEIYPPNEVKPLVNSSKFIEIAPLRHKDYISSNKLVWFSLYSYSNEEVFFTKIFVKIPTSLKSRSKVMNLANDDTSYSVGDVGPIDSITKGNLIHWKKQVYGYDDCGKYFNISESDPNKPVKVYFKKKALCG